MIIDKTQLSCIHHVMCMMNIFMVCIPPVSYRMAWWIFLWYVFHLCPTGCVEVYASMVFWIEVSSSNGLSIIRPSIYTFHMEVVHTICIFHVKSVYVLCSLCTQCFCRSRDRSPDFTARSLCRSRVWFPGPTACFRPLESLACVTVVQSFWVLL
jgi:hypothetical protein